MASRAKALMIGVPALALVVAGAWLRAGGLVAAAEVRAEFERIVAEGGTNDSSATRLVLASGMPEILEPPAVAGGKIVARDALVLVEEHQRYEVSTTGTGSKQRTTSGWQTSHTAARYARVRLDGRDVAPQLLDGLDTSRGFPLDEAALAALGATVRPAANQVFFGSGTPSSPRAGDVRQLYTWAQNAEITVLALQRGHQLERTTRLRETLGVPLEFDIGVAREGRLDGAAMAAVQRDAIGRGSGLARVFGAIAIIIGGFVLIPAAGNLFGRREPGLEHPAQLAVLFAWLFMAWPLRWSERFVEAALPWPPVIAVGCIASALALACGMVALFGALPGWLPAQRSLRARRRAERKKLAQQRSPVP